MTMNGKNTTKSPDLVAAVAYDGLCTFEFGCVVEIFGLKRPELNIPWYRFGICASEIGPLRATGGFCLSVPNDLTLLDEADTIIIPGWRDSDEQPPSELLERLVAAHQRGARLCSICSGAFVVAATGLLDGKAATTHWRYTEKFRQRYPKVELRPNELYVVAGNLVTSAGSAAGLDMMLHLIRADHGARIANLIAQRLVVAPHREGGQAQYLPRPMPPGERNALGPLMEWIGSNLRQQHTLCDLARRAGMSIRTLQRRFREATGMTPKEWIIQERIGLAKYTLEVTDAPLWDVAQNSGFGSEESFRHHFRKVTSTSPMRYRNQFSIQRPG